MTDWLSRKVGGVIDFRLPGDPDDIPSSVITARMQEYYMQRWAAEGREAPRFAGAGPVTPAPPPPSAEPPAADDGDDWWRAPPGISGLL